MHNHLSFPDFSAHVTVAASPAAEGVTEKPPASGGSDAATNQGHIMAPPFSWLGGDAWPNFPGRGTTLP